MFLKANKTFSENKLKQMKLKKIYAKEGNLTDKQHNEYISI